MAAASSGVGAPMHSDLVRDSQLETTFQTLPASGAASIFLDVATTHTRVTSDRRARQRQVRHTELWRRRRELGRGTFGRVWLEECLEATSSSGEKDYGGSRSNDNERGGGVKQGQLRAVKEIEKQKGGSAVDYRRELEAIAKFSHEKYESCFVHSDGWFENDGSIFIAMEYIEYGDLQRHMKKQFPDGEAREIASQLVEGLVYMHDNGFAHRDLKPGNILIVNPGPSWWVKISDFGISKRTSGTSLNTVIGTHGYLAPEVLFNSAELSYDVAVDVWALGQIAFRMLTSRMAFSGGQTGDLYKYVTQTPGRLGTAFPRAVLKGASASDGCCDFVEKAMAARPEGRPSARELSNHEWIARKQDVAPGPAVSQSLLLPPQPASLLPLTVNGSVPGTEYSARWTTQEGSSLMLPNTTEEPEFSARWTTQQQSISLGPSTTQTETKAAQKQSPPPLERREVAKPQASKLPPVVPSAAVPGRPLLLPNSGQAAVPQQAKPSGSKPPAVKWPPSTNGMPTNVPSRSPAPDPRLPPKKPSSPASAIVDAPDVVRSVGGLRDALERFLRLNATKMFDRPSASAGLPPSAIDRKRPGYISSPYNATHLWHVDFDAKTGKFLRLPSEWEDSGVNDDRLGETPGILSVMEVLDFYNRYTQENDQNFPAGAK